MTKRTQARLIGGFALVVVLWLPAVAHGQDPFGAGGPDSILSGYSAAYNNWTSALGQYGMTLFRLLATIDFAWTIITLAIEKQDMQAWIAGIIRKLMTIAFFYALLTNGVQWTGFIVQSFMQLGAAGSGGQVTATTQPSEIMRMGLDIAGRLMSGAAGATPGAFDFVTNPFGSLAPALILVIAAFLVVIAFLIVTVHFIMALVESYLVLAAGFIFLGFGGSRWTVPFTEKYISLVVSVGARLMVLFLVIGLGFSFADIWAAEAQSAAALGGAGFTSAAGLQGTEACFSLVAEVGIYGLVCWILPQLAANVIGGTLSFSAGDAIGAGATAATAGLAAAQAVAAVGAAVATGGAAAPVAAADVAAIGAAAGGGAASAGGGAAGAAGMAGAMGGGGGGMVGGMGAAAAPAGESGGVAVQPPPPPDLGGGGAPGGGGDGSVASESGPATGSAADGGPDAGPGAGEVSSSIQQANAAGAAAKAQALRAGSTQQEASDAFDQAFANSMGVVNSDNGAATADAEAAADGDAGLEASAMEGDRDMETGATTNSPSGNSPSSVAETGGAVNGAGPSAPAVPSGEDLSAPGNTSNSAPSEITGGSDQSGANLAGEKSSPNSVFETGKGVSGASPDGTAVASGKDLAAPESTSNTPSFTPRSGAGVNQPRPPQNLFGAARNGIQNARNTIQQVNNGLPNDGGTISGASPKMDHGE